MADMTGAVMAHISNYFEGEPVVGTIRIESGNLYTPDDFDNAARYVAIRGSRAHDGVWQLSDGHIYHDGQAPEEPDETFWGMVWPLYPSASFQRLCREVEAFAKENQPSAIASESFGAYSYSLATGPSGKPVTWQEQFAEQLRQHRRMFTDVGV